MAINNTEYLPGLSSYSPVGLVGVDGSDGNTLYFSELNLDLSTNSAVKAEFSKMSAQDLIISKYGLLYNKSKERLGSIFNYELNLDRFYIDKYEASTGKIYFDIDKSLCIPEDGVIYELRSKYTNEIKTVEGYEQ